MHQSAQQAGRRRRRCRELRGRLCCCLRWLPCSLPACGCWGAPPQEGVRPRRPLGRYLVPPAHSPACTGALGQWLVVTPGRVEAGEAHLTPSWPHAAAPAQPPCAASIPAIISSVIAVVMCRLWHGEPMHGESIARRCAVPKGRSKRRRATASQAAWAQGRGSSPPLQPTSIHRHPGRRTPCRQ